MLHLLRRLLGVDPVESFRPRTLKTRGLTEKHTVCTFCSCGCGMTAFVREGRLVSLEGDPDHPINEGTLCAKGAAAAGLHHAADRLRQPLLREPRSGEFLPVSWDDALSRIVARLARLRRETWVGPARRSDAIGFLGGAVNSNEEAYAWRKLAALLGVCHVEHQARI